MNTGRIIRLRPPVTLSVMDEPYVPPGASGVLDEVDRRWDDLRSRNPAFYDGRLLHVIGVHRNGYGGAVLHVVDCAYRFHAVQDETFDLGVRPLGVKGLAVREREALLGLRSPTVAAYAGQWEFAPGGVVEPGENPCEVVKRELEEETGLNLAREPLATAVIFDPVLRAWEIVYRLHVDGTIDLSSGEYTDAGWHQVNRLPQPLTPIARQMVALLDGL